MYSITKESKMKSHILPIIFSSLFLAAQPCTAQEARFDWSNIINYQQGVNFSEGNQILHYRSYNTPYFENIESQQFVNQYMQQAKQFTSDAEMLRFSSDNIGIDGLILELGVCTGTTINFIAALNPQQT